MRRGTMGVPIFDPRCIKIAASLADGGLAMRPENIDFSKRRLFVFIYEIRQEFVWGDELGQRYTQTVSLSNGATRSLELTPMIRHGMPVVEFKDTGHCSYMGLNGTTTNGTLMVQIRDYDAARDEWKRWSAASPVLPPDTSLLARPDFVPAGFIHGIEILNDNATDMDFVVSVLGAHVGLSFEEAIRIMLEIHTHGGVVLPTASLADAERIAAQISAAAAQHRYPLVCRPVNATPDSTTSASP
jgi:ATP-dependent Clp protease adapter protein ClpS